MVLSFDSANSLNLGHPEEIRGGFFLAALWVAKKFTGGFSLPMA